VWAYSNFYSLNDYQDSQEKAADCLDRMNQHLQTLAENRQYPEAIGYITDIYYMMEELNEATLAEKMKPYADTLYDSFTAVQDYSLLPDMYSLMTGYQFEKTEFWVQEKERHFKFWYQKAIAFQSEKDYLNAVIIFDTLGAYGNSKTYSLSIKQDKNYLLSAPAGAEIVFGRYEQDNNSYNGTENIEWIILEKNGSKVFVVSKFILDCTNYDGYSDTTWEKSSLREWLNKTFYTSAFSTAEQKQILLSSVVAHRNPSSDRDPGNDTTDKIFLLSVTEMNKYFPTIGSRKCSLSDYAESKTSFAFYWLRSPGKETDPTHGGSKTNNVAVITDAGELSQKDCWDDWGVRPAMWIDLGA